MKGEILDLPDIYHEEYAAGDKPHLVRCLKGRYLTISGRGRLWDDEFRRRLGLMQSVLHSVQKKQAAAAKPFQPGPLEIILPQSPEPGQVDPGSREDMEWKLLVRIPLSVSEHERLDAVMELLESEADPAVTEVRQEVLKEGLSVQQLHRPGLTALEPVIDRLRSFAAGRGYSTSDYLHVIYPADPPAGEELAQPVVIRLVLKEEPPRPGRK